MKSRMRVFFNTRITNDRKFSLLWGRPLNWLGNFFLAPTRFLFSGKTVRLEPQGTDQYSAPNPMSKVSSFYHEDWDYNQSGQVKGAKQNLALRSNKWTDWSNILVLPAALLFIPLAILGSVFKGLSYLDGDVRKASKLVRNKLTPTNETIGSKEQPTPKHNDMLKVYLYKLLESGQKVNELKIYAEDHVLSADCLELIFKINPKQVILMSEEGQDKWTLADDVVVPNIIKTIQNVDKWKKWNLLDVGFDEAAMSSTVETQQSRDKTVSAIRSSRFLYPREYQKGPIEYKKKENKSDGYPELPEPPQVSLSSMFKLSKTKHAIRVADEKTYEAVSRLKPNSKKTAKS